MKFGMPTLIECNDVEANVRAAAERRLDFVELNLSFPQYNISRLDTKVLLALSDKYGVAYTFHADEQFNPFDFDDSVSECYTDVMRRSILLAREVGALVINMHLLSGVYVTLPDGRVYLNDVYRESYIKKVTRFISLCEQWIGGSDIKICIENLDAYPFLQCHRAAIELFMKSPVFALTLDVGHDCITRGKDRDIYLTYPQKLRHMHLHDCDGIHPHLSLGDGGVDIMKTLSLFKPQTCLIEVKTLAGLDKSIEYLKRNCF